VVGSSNIDLIARVPRLPRLGETLLGRSFTIGYGGKGANQAVMAAQLGARVAMVTKLGRDVFGEDTVKNFRAHGIDTSHVSFDEQRFSGVAPIFVDDDAQNFIVVVPGANDGLSPVDVQSAREAILWSGSLVCQLEVPTATVVEAFRIARAGGVRTILNPAPALPLPGELLALTDVLAPNETETEQLTGSSVRTVEGGVAAARRLLAQGPLFVILTLGERGALVVDASGADVIPPVKVAAVDPTGAGDAFIGSLATFLGEGEPMRMAARKANAVAALSVTRMGTQTSFPSRAEADAFLNEVNP
jgi:ribokinase